MNTRYMYMIFSLIALTGTSCWGDATQNLLTAAQNGDLRGVTDALAQEADVNARNNDQQTVLMLAANIVLFTPTHQLNYNFKNKLPIINTLLNHINAQGEKDIQIDATDNNGWTALMFAANQHGSSQTVNVLIKAGANVNATADDGITTALALAQKSKSVISITELQAAGAK